MKEVFLPPQHPPPPIPRDKCHLILCMTGAGQCQGQSPNADAQQLSALKPRGVVAMGMERGFAGSIWSLCLSRSEAAGFGGKRN